MGNDGGSIPTRRELVKEAARDASSSEVKATQNEQQHYYWTTDPISREPLAAPVVSDAHGKLYNKATILEYLVEGARKADADAMTRGAVKSLKDVVEVKFTVDDDNDPDPDPDAPKQANADAWKCPVTGDRLGPGSKAAYIVPCGHAFSGSAIKEVSGEKCLTCDTEYASNDIIPLLPTAETDIARLSLRVKALQEKGLSHSLKKASGGKKRKKKDDAGNVSDNGLPEKHVPTVAHGKTDSKASYGINNSSTASLTAKVLQEQEQAKKRKLDSENVRSLFSSKDQAKDAGKNRDFMTRGYSVR